MYLLHLFGNCGRGDSGVAKKLSKDSPPVQYSHRNVLPVRVIFNSVAFIYVAYKTIIFTYVSRALENKLDISQNFLPAPCTLDI
jgi:hypothetical protein